MLIMSHDSTPTPDLAAIRQRLYQATNCSTDLTTVIPADLFTYLQRKNGGRWAVHGEHAI